MAITLEQVEMSFPRKQGELRVLDGIDLRIAAHEFLTVLGPSGCGKSTLLRLIAGLAQPTAGRVLVDGTPVVGPGPDRGMVFQAFTSFPWLTVRENIAFGLRFLPAVRARAQAAAVDRYLRRFGLAEFADEHPGALSGGMQQRLAIARALVPDPAVILMDEPFGSLDSQTRGIMQEELTGFWERLRKTVVFVTHDIEEALFLTDRLCVLTARPARVKAILDLRALLPRPRTSALKASPAFARLKQRVLALIHDEAVQAAHQR